MLLVVTSERVGIERAQLGGNNREPLGLETAEDLADEASFDGVGLADDERAIHGCEAIGELTRLDVRSASARRQV